MQFASRPFTKGFPQNRIGSPNSQADCDTGRIGPITYPSRCRGARNSFPPSFLAAIVPGNKNCGAPKVQQKPPEKTGGCELSKRNPDYFFSISPWSGKL